MSWPYRAALVVLGVLALAGVQPAAAQEASDIPWQTGPGVGRLGDIAEIQIPEGYHFAGRDGVKRFLELTQNPASGGELGVLLPPGNDGGPPWFVVFTFSPIGYVRDDDKNELDAEAILNTIRKGTEAANREREKRGWGAMRIVGWEQPPRYDSITHNLTWAIRGGDQESEVINYSVRLLGRRGVMHADLVLSPEQLEATVPEFDGILTGFDFVQGNRYAEFVKGDKIAEYGLTALIAGGVGAAAMKSGLLAKLWKAIVVGVLAILAAIKRMLFGSRDEQVEGVRNA